MPRGGRRSGKPGASYPNRSDLATQPVRTVPGQTYGQAGQQAAAQQAIPLPATPSVQASPAPTPFVPPEPGMLHAPSARPGEPVTAGLPIGAGAGPEAINQNSTSTNAADELRAVYSVYPTEELRQIIERIERG